MTVVEIALGIFFGFTLPLVILLASHEGKIFELYQRFGWLQRDIQKIREKLESS